MNGLFMVRLGYVYAHGNKYFYDNQKYFERSSVKPKFQGGGLKVQKFIFER